MSRLWVLAIALLALGALAIGSAAADPDPARGREVALGIASGHAPRTSCASCHGVEGGADVSGAFPKLAGQAPWYLYKQLLDYATGRREHPVMSPIARQLTEADMENVAAYYAAQDPVEHTRPEADVLTLQEGGAISAMGIPAEGVPACENCHGADAAGMPPSYPSLAGQYAPYLQLQLELFKSGERDNDAVAVMRRVAEEMSEEEIEAVSIYLEHVRTQEEDRPGGEQ